MTAPDERTLAIFRMFEKHWHTSSLPEDPHCVELALRTVVADYLASPANASTRESELLGAIDRTLDAYRMSYEAESAVQIGQRESLAAESHMVALTKLDEGDDS